MWFFFFPLVQKEVATERDINGSSLLLLLLPIVLLFKPCTMSSLLLRLPLLIVVAIAKFVVKVLVAGGDNKSLP